ncbi:hypothetical protein [Variovorax ginsengisoli]|uniref:Uncharacterized protein n=1 Tax=Variovorax ginsengisoli TaxID=363844 RepID=A0ABT8SBW5_9BURK|nr:hypothetical protein [Variovorax ginsengisoli]MDN8617242.1 hypothetical protein [Variovorax ginsengisoli]MDO1536412.1 hypothetical protein [Variovorax ginsengisoli]
MNNFIRYKPLRNLARSYNLQRSLEDLWFYFQMYEGAFPIAWTWDGRRRVFINEQIFKWELAALSRELVLHASPAGTLRLSPVQGLVRLTNMLKQVDDNMAADDMSPESAYNSLSPTGQVQFAWQRNREFNALMRYYKVFSAPDVEALLMKQTGVTTREWFLVGFAIAGHLRKRFDISSQQDYSPIGVERARSAIVFDKLSQPLAELQDQVRSAARFDETWRYTWNPLTAKPLVALNPNTPHLLHCPVPAFVLSRVSQGLYYEISAAEGFNNPFGESFQAYIGEVLVATFPSPRFELLEEREYKVGRATKHGADWILTDDQANLFIECKAKRMTQEAKSAVDPATIGQQVDFLAKAVVQLYKNIADALAGHTHWKPNNLPVYPMVVTMEDWYLFGVSADLLVKSVETKMAEARLDLEWLETMPYSVASSQDLENVSPTIAEVGIGTFFSARSPEHRKWMLQAFARQLFPEVYRRTVNRDLFEEEWVNIVPLQALPEKFSRPKA